jgi:hypothetical protein
VVVALRDWAEEFGEPPRIYEWSVSAARTVGAEDGRVKRWAAEHPRWPGSRPVVKYFGSWSAALSAAGLREEPLAPWELSLGERVEISRRLDRAGLRTAEIAELLDVKPETVRAYLRAGVCPDCGGPVISRHARRCQGCAARLAHRAGWGAEEIIAALRAWAKEHGSPPSALDWTPTEDTTLQWAREYPRWPGTGQVLHTFGGWNQALEAAGLDTRKRRWDRESVIAAVRAFAERHGRSPTTAELKGAEELPSREVIIRYCGSLEACRDVLEAQKGAKPANGWLPPVHQRWDRERIVEAIKAFAAEHGRPPMSTDWKRASADHPGVGSVVGHFGSFAAGLAAAGYVSRRTSWDRDQIVAAINSHLSEHGELPTPKDWRERDPAGARPAIHNVHQQFGNWGNALEAAGHTHAVERWDRRAMLAALRDLGRELKRRPTQRDLQPKRPGRPGLNSVKAEFGSFTAALEVAGFPIKRRWGRKATIQALKNWSAEYGRSPTYDDWRRSSERHPGVSTVEQLFGSWTEGLRASGLPIAKRNWDRVAIVGALRAWAAEHGRPPSSADWRGADPTGRRPATYRVQREFGTWGAALDAAGVASAAHTSTNGRSAATA